MTYQTLEQCLTEHGYSIPNYQIEKIVRFNPSDKPKRNKSAWLKVFSNGNAIFGNWATGEQHIYSEDGEQLPKDEWIKLQREREAERKQFEANQLDQHKSKALEAQNIITNAKPAPLGHPYLVKKGIQSHSALFGDVLSYKDALIIPVMGSEPPLVNQVQSLQFIMPNGDKRFLSHGKMGGGYHAIQTINGAPIVIGESFSTCATLAEHYCPYSTVICAFNAGGLLNIAKYFRRENPTTTIILAADNDWELKENIGLVKATAAAKAVNGIVSMPIFKSHEIGMSDFNDRHLLDRKELNYE